MYNIDDQIELLKESLLRDASIPEINTDFIHYASFKQSIQGKVNEFEDILEHHPSSASRYGKDIININDLLKYEGEQFVEASYIKILNRPSDLSGLSVFCEALKSGRMQKMDIINEFISSQEGQLVGNGFTGYSSYSLERLYQYNDRQLLEIIYPLFLGRFAREEDVRVYLPRLRKGELTSVEVIYSVYHSPEAVDNHVRPEIQGLEKAYKRRVIKNKVLHIPLIGRMIRWGLGIGRMNRKTDEMMECMYDLLDQCQAMNIQQNQMLNRIHELEWETYDNKRKNNDLINDVINLYSNYQNQQEEVQDIRQATQRIQLIINDIQGNLTEMSKQIEYKLASNDQWIKTYEPYIKQIGDNIHDINSSLAQHDDLINGLKTAQSDSARLFTEISNVSARLTKVENQGVHSESKPIDLAEKPLEVSVIPQADEYEAIDYFDFENHFRGDREYIKQAQTIYLPYYEGRKHVLDLGCGRGEFTELLVEHNIGVTGVDQYAPYVEYMKMLGLPVMLDDAVHYLRTQSQVDGIFLGQVVEHITIEQIVEICRLAYEQLEKGCYLIMETPNPMSLAIFTHSFYIDPSHQKPVHPYTLKYIAEKAGFSKVDILFTENSKLPDRIPEICPNDESFHEFNHSMQSISELLYGSQDYAIIAQK